MFGFSLHFSRWGAIVTLLLSLVSVFLAVPNLLPQATYETLPKWLQLPRMPLGLDLRGGTHLLYELDPAQLKQEWLQTLQAQSRHVLTEEKIAHLGVLRTPNQVRIKVRDADKTEQALVALKKLSAPVAGGMDAAITQAEDNTILIEPTEAGLKARLDSAVKRTVEVVRHRVDPNGTTEALIQQQGDERILVQVPGLTPEKVKELVGTTAKLTFQLVDISVGNRGILRKEEADKTPAPPETVWLPYDEEPGYMILVKKEIAVDGDTLYRAAPDADHRNGAPVVSFSFNNKGALDFARVTRENVNKPFAIVLDGKVISAPNIHEAITQGQGQISGRFTQQKVEQLSLLLNSGALPATLIIQEEQAVGPTIGADAIEAGKKAAIVGFVLVSLLMIASYGLFGLFSVIALVVNIAIIIAGLSLFSASLTLPGIAGMVLTMGVAVDANVLIYERIREEQKQGRSMISSIEAGFDRAYATIIDSHLTGLVAAVILYAFGSGTVKGFAVTLIFGIISSLFTAITVTRLMVSTWLRQARPSVLHI